MIIVPKRQIWTQQPQYPVSVDGSHPLAPKSGLWLPGISRTNLVTKIPFTTPNSSIKPIRRVVNGKAGLGLDAGTSRSTGDPAAIQTDIPSNAFSVITVIIALTPRTSPSTSAYSAVVQMGQFMVLWDHASPGYRYAAALYNNNAYSKLAFSQLPTVGVRTTLAFTYDGTALSLYRDGVLDSSTTMGNGVSGVTYRGFQLLCCSGDNITPGVDIDYVYLDRTRALNAEQIRDISRNPFAVFQPRSRHVFVGASGGGDVSLALLGSMGSTATGVLSPSISASVSGQSSTTATGSLTPSTATFEAALTGSAATTATGAAAPAISKALTGSAATTDTGAAAPAISKALTGSAATTATGAAAPAISKALTGSAATTATGAAAPAISKALTGSAATTATGAAAPAISKALTGSAATTATGSLTPDGAIAGTGVTTTTGTLSPALSKSIEGQAATTVVGTLSVTLSSALAGVASVTSAGNLTAQTADIVISGQQTTTATGALAASVTTTLSGAGSTADAGVLTVVQNPVEGLQVTTAVGLLTPALTLSLTGRQIAASAGYLDSGAPTFREIVYLKSGIHPSVTLSSPLSG